MDHDEFFEFLRVKNQFVALQYAIEMKEFSRFKKPFTSNKYLSMLHWEEINRRIEKVFAKRHKQEDELEPMTAGSFTFDDCFCASYKILPRSESCINFDKLKFEYKLDWFIAIKITRLHATPTAEDPVIDLNTQISKPAASVMCEQGIEYVPVSNHMASIVSNSSYVPSSKSKSTVNNKLPIEYSPRADNRHGSASYAMAYTPSKINSKRGTTKGDPQPAATEQKSSQIAELFGEDSSDEHTNARYKDEIGPSDDEVETSDRKRLKMQPQEPEVPVQSSRASTRYQNELLSSTSSPRPAQQAKIDLWLSKKSFKDAQKSSPKCKRGGRNKTLENRNPADLMNEENMNKMNDFVAKAQQLAAVKEKRKEELKDLIVLHCNDMTNKELKDLVLAFEPEVKRLFAKTIATMREKRDFDPVMLSTSPVLTEKQISFVCQQIELLRDVNDRGGNEDVLMYDILPEFIIELFSQKFDMSREEALIRLKTQDERRSLYGGDDSF